MKYRTLGKQKRKVSVLGFGAMRFPVHNGNDAEIQREPTIQLLHRAIDAGINYIDTAYVYHGGHSEQLVAEALSQGNYRHRTYVATKLPIWNVQKPSDFDQLLDEQLRNLRTEQIDFYLLHCLQRPEWNRLLQLGLLEWCDRVVKSGKVGELGFSFHDSFEMLEEIVHARDWSFCQVQYNLVNEHTQAGTRGVEFLHHQGLDVIVMEPLLGGTLAAPPEPIAKLYAEAGRDPVEIALLWLWEKQGISLLLSGMNTTEQLEQNLRLADMAGEGKLTPSDYELIAAVQQTYEKLSPIPCTKCRYCIPNCPQGVAIPDNFEMYNNAQTFGGSNLVLNHNLYHLLPSAQQASSCIQCGACAKHCPQSLPIPELLEKVVKLFA